MAFQTTDFCVLVMGYRQGLVEALARMKIACAIWTEKPIKSAPACLHLHIGEFPRNDDDIFEVVAQFEKFGPFTQVIAGSEASVYPAAVARRILNARISTKTVALRCHDKLQMKSFLNQHDIPMTDFVPGDEIEDANAIVERLGTPLVIKSRHESGGRGIRLVDNAPDLVRYSGRGKIIEKFVSAPEASVESYISEGKILFENVTQYYVKKHINLVPGAVSAEQEKALLTLNRQVITALKIKWGITHMEAYLSDSGILFGEIALRPPGGYIMDLISKAYGFSSWEALVHVELDLPFQFTQACVGYTAVCIIHPGAGTVLRIDHWNQVGALPSVYRKKIKIKPGALIAERQGVGEDAGYLLLSNSNQDDLLSDIKQIDEKLDIVMGRNLASETC